MSRSMRAARMHAFGPPDVLRVEEAPVPALGPKDVRVRVHATSVNPADCKTRAGSLRGVVRIGFPWILGLDVSGVVEAVGPEVRRFAPGDEVYGSPPHTRPGAYAEYVAVDEAVLAPKPKGLSHVQAAVLPLVSLTAWESLEAGGVGPGHRVLVLAGSGGVGAMAVQLARARGATVIATTTADNFGLVRSLGASEVLDYREGPIWARVRDLDFVLVTLGGGERSRALSAVRRGGTVVCIVEDIPRFTARLGPYLGLLVAGAGMGAFWAQGRLRGRRAVNLIRHADGRLLAGLTPLFESGAVRPVIDRELPLEAIAEAHRYSETGRARGKIAIRVA